MVTPDPCRVAADERIFSGVARDAYTPPVYCESRPTIDAPDAAPYAMCGSDGLLELCDQDTGWIPSTLQDAK